MQLVACGHQRELGVVVEPAQVVLEQAFERRQQVTGGEAVRGAGQAADNGNVQACGYAQGRKTEWAWTGDVQHVGAPTLPMAQQFGLHGHAPLPAWQAR